MVFVQNLSDSAYQTCYQCYHQADHQLLSSLPSYLRETLGFFGHAVHADFQQVHHQVI